MMIPLWLPYISVRGPPGALEGVPGGSPQLHDSLELSGPLWVCNSGSLQMGQFGSIN